MNTRRWTAGGRAVVFIAGILFALLGFFAWRAIRNVPDLVRGVDRSPSPNGELDLIAQGNVFYLVMAGDDPTPSDEVLRVDGDCPSVTGAKMPSDRAPAEFEVLCIRPLVGWGWTSDSEVQFQVSDGTRVINHVDHVRGISVTIAKP